IRTHVDLVSHGVKKIVPGVQLWEGLKGRHDKLIFSRPFHLLAREANRASLRFVLSTSCAIGYDEIHSMPLLEIKNLRLEFGTGENAVRAVDDVSLSIEAGETVCLVGESGSGKSVTALSIARLVP